MGVKNMVPPTVHRLKTDLTLLHIHVRKIGFKDPKMHALVRIFRLNLLDLKFIVEFYQLN